MKRKQFKNRRKWEKRRGENEVTDTIVELLFFSLAKPR